MLAARQHEPIGAGRSDLQAKEVALERRGVARLCMCGYMWQHHALCGPGHGSDIPLHHTHEKQVCMCMCMCVCMWTMSFMLGMW